MVTRLSTLTRVQGINTFGTALLLRCSGRELSAAAKKEGESWQSHRVCELDGPRPRGAYRRGINSSATSWMKIANPKSATTSRHPRFVGSRTCHPSVACPRLARYLRCGVCPQSWGGAASAWLAYHQPHDRYASCALACHLSACR